MGLDQYIEIKDRETGEWEEYQYYRKFNELQGWFEDNHNQQNCGVTEMTVDVIDALLEDISNDKLTITEGFFYGNYKATKEDLDRLSEILLELRDLVEDNEEVRYTCWY